MKIIICILLIVSINGLMPRPQTHIKGTKTVKIVNSCALHFIQGFKFPNHILELLRHYHSLMTNELRCQFEDSIVFNLKNQGGLKLQIHLENEEQLYSVENTKQEKYTLKIDEQLNIIIHAENHWGLARALDTVNQLTENNEINNLPLFIEDEPAYTYRGIMVDTARHYLSVKVLERTIDAMVLNKLNVLHWHITDDESFPLLLSNYSKITNATKFWETAIFTKSDVKHLVEYASIRGVSIIPEIDSPAHVQSWGRGTDLEEIILNCGTIKQYGQFDPTMDLTYEVVKSVFQDLSDMFDKAPFIHFGGDEALNSCYKQRPSIQEFMDNNGIGTFDELQTYYRKKQKDIWKNQIGSSKRNIYWYNEDGKLPAESDDIIHWWGTQITLEKVKDMNNDFILSDYKPLYLDIGMGNAFGNSYQTYQTWKDIYKWQINLPEGFQGRILGAEAPLWGETNNENTHFQKLFIRSSVLADTLWNPTSKETEQFYEFADRLGQMEDRMNNYGFPVSPFTHDYCKRHTKICFPVLYNPQDQQNQSDL